MSASAAEQPVQSGADPLAAAQAAAAALTDFTLTGEQRGAVVAGIKGHLHLADQAERGRS